MMMMCDVVHGTVVIHRHQNTPFLLSCFLCSSHLLAETILDGHAALMLRKAFIMGHPISSRQLREDAGKNIDYFPVPSSYSRYCRSLASLTKVTISLSLSSSLSLPVCCIRSILQKNEDMHTVYFSPVHH